jgi:hypothetical protein
VNGADERMLGLRRSEVVGKLRSELALPPDPVMMRRDR